MQTQRRSRLTSFAFLVCASALVWPACGEELSAPDGGGERQCFGPNKNLDVAYDGVLKGCSCDTTVDADQCIGGVALVCSEGHWLAVEDGPCSPDAGMCPPGFFVDLSSGECEQNAAVPLEAACSTGPVYTAEYPFAQGTWEEAGVPCTPHCGEDETQYWRGTGIKLHKPAAVPSGACEPNTAPCAMDVGQTCHGDPYAIWVSVVCKCATSSWVCAGSYMGGGVCPASVTNF